MTARSKTPQAKRPQPKPRKPKVELFDPFERIFKVKPQLDPLDRHFERKTRKDEW